MSTDTALFGRFVSQTSYVWLGAFWTLAHYGSIMQHGTGIGTRDWDISTYCIMSDGAHPTRNVGCGLRHRCKGLPDVEIGVQ